MKSVSLFGLLILLLISATGGVAYFQYQRAERLERELLSLQAIDLQRKVGSDISVSEENAVVKVDDMESVSGRRAAAKDIEPTAADTGERNIQQIAQASRIVMEKPEYRRALQLKQNAWVEGKYGELFAQLNLDPKQLSDLRRLLQDRQFAYRDVQMAANELGLGVDQRAELRALSQQTKAEIEAEMRELIGDQKYGQIGLYERTANQRAAIDQLEARLSYSNTPLNAAQNQALHKLFNVALDGQNPARVWTLNEASMAQAQGVLSEEQLGVLRVLMEEQSIEQTLNNAKREIHDMVQLQGDGSISDGG